MSNPDVPMAVEFALVEYEYLLWKAARDGHLPALPYEEAREFKVEREGVGMSQAPAEHYRLTVKLEKTA